MPGSFNIRSHEKVVPECKGCQRIHKYLNGRVICNYHRFPHTMWWFGETCPQATHIKYRNDEDPVKEP